MKRNQALPLSDRKYHEILADMGLLDDEEDWKLYLEQEKRFELDEAAEEVWVNLHKVSSEL